MDYPGSYYIERVFDELNRLTGIKLNGAGTPAVEFDYDQLSRRTGLTYENGTSVSYNNQLDNDLDQIVQTFVGSSVTFGYDFNAIHQLTGQSVSDDQFMWHPAASGTTTYGTANDLNQYPTVGGVSQTYDDNGCLTGDGTWTYGFDTINQLISATDGMTSASYLYDPMGRQLQKDVGGTKTNYLYGGMQRLADYDGSGTLLQRYVYGTGLDEPLIKITSGGTKTYMHHDRMGNIVAITDNAGAVTNRYKYSPWGESPSMSGTTFGFQGQRYDSETGLYYMKARYYDSKTGRFLQSDPIGYGDGLNIYQFAYNNPNSFSDPLGLAADGSVMWSDTASFGGASGGISTGGSSIFPVGGGVSGGFAPGAEGQSGAYTSPSGTAGAAAAAAAGAAGILTYRTVLIGGVAEVWIYRTIYVPNMLGFGIYEIGQLIPLTFLIGVVTYGLLNELGEAIDRFIDALYDFNKRPPTTNELDQMAKKDQTPNGIKSFHSGGNEGGPGDKDHVHFEDGSALNKDGTWRHDPSGLRNPITAQIAKFLTKVGWTLPK